MTVICIVILLAIVVISSACGVQEQEKPVSTGNTVVTESSTITAIPTARPFTQELQMLCEVVGKRIPERIANNPDYVNWKEYADYVRDCVGRIPLPTPTPMVRPVTEYIKQNCRNLEKKIATIKADRLNLNLSPEPYLSTYNLECAGREYAWRE